ncbi:nudix hydrolase 10-like [Solanum verrucosum]|uniref:nudix hydrolase 10-like n=1 Tax=Solanum verrucosum TaxID=315347 RepID=UPI0020D13401|nr:nudix hydrolase 10-like [Solanum verrucosum]
MTMPTQEEEEIREERCRDGYCIVAHSRQSHKSFFVCMLKPLSYNIQKQDSEIEGAQWMAIEEYAAHPFIMKHEMFNKIAEICLPKKENKYNGFSKVLMTSAFSTKRTYLYYNQN